MNRLEKHQVIAIDFDETLIGHKNSRRLADHIRYNPDKTYWIITFRSHGNADEDILFEELYCEHQLTRDRFAGVVFIPSKIWDESFGDELVFKSWKGKTAAELGCTVLIDDRPGWTEIGCKRHRIEFIDTNNIKPFKKD